jgi:hypothetical protein
MDQTEHRRSSSDSHDDEALRAATADPLLPAQQPMAGPGEEPGTEASLPHARPTGAAIASTIALAVLGFIAAAALIHIFIRRPFYLHADMRSEKLVLLDKWKGNAYSASFGSSHVHDGFDPRVFDSELNGTPLQTRSINLAVAGGSQTEQRLMALEFMHGLKPPPRTASAAPQSCMVLLELGAGANMGITYLVHPRTIDIYDMASVRFVHSLTTPSMPRNQRWGRMGFAAAAAAEHYMNVGMLSAAIFNLPLDEITYHAETIDDRRGFLRLPTQTSRMSDELSRESRRGLSSPGELMPGNYSLIDELRHATSATGVQFVYLVMPNFEDLDHYEIYPDLIVVDGQNVPIVDLARPDLYPELYQAKYWHDNAHLNEPGADLSMKLVAKQLKNFYAHHPLTACGG